MSCSNPLADCATLMQLQLLNAERTRTTKRRHRSRTSSWHFVFLPFGHW